MSLRLRARKFLLSLLRKTADRPPDQSATIRKLNDALVDLATKDNAARDRYMERLSELVEARQMAGSGPWTVSPATLASTDRIIQSGIQNFGKPQMAVRESAGAITAQGARGDVELMLQNVEWRREVNLSWLEFSRWGIQQLILICRLHFIKHPWIRRGITLSAAYVMGQGVEISSPDQAANDQLKRWRERNKTVLGQIGLTEQEKRKGYDGNLFWCQFADTQDTGEVNIRLIDATEIQEVWLDPDDAGKPMYYRRVWSQMTPDVVSGTMKTSSGDEWYPALGYTPKDRPKTIGDKKVNWDSPVYHRKVGGVANWTFGCPRAYSAIEYAQEGKRMLAACASVTAALSQIAIQITTKGGQQALEGIKNQMGTGVGPSSAILDMNPPATAGSTFASGPGTVLQAFKTRGAGTDPSEVKEFRNMAACGLEIPPTWLGDMETSNLSTALTLDRPTELGFLLKQEEWQEDLSVMAQYALNVSKSAPGGKLREAIAARKTDGDVEIREAARVIVQNKRHWVYEAAPKPDPKVIEVLVSFPAIREGDIPNLVKATLDAMAIDRTGKGHGIDDKTAVRKFCELLDIENADELVEKLYPEKTYDHDRTKLPPDDMAPQPGTAPKQAPKPVTEARIREALGRVDAALLAREATNGHTHTHAR